MPLTTVTGQQDETQWSSLCWTPQLTTRPQRGPDWTRDVKTPVWPSHIHRPFAVCRLVSLLSSLSSKGGVSLCCQHLPGEPALCHIKQGRTMSRRSQSGCTAGLTLHLSRIWWFDDVPTLLLTILWLHVNWHVGILGESFVNNNLSMIKCYFRGTDQLSC